MLLTVACGEGDPCVEVPEDIYDIPPESPSHNVTYVQVYDYDDEGRRKG